ncbi:hypothetical protein KIN20_007241 [Parelaphostrongylus tenuis]|uniref:Uncharacterized protein n=1 Tax=Parelaphostrongylus tenuis TaxID=148309 RepID=A0AAD5MLW3_PARTN|nr:hypothetical protein KIN20_007241 [Parelaphostrongylus tenuis]
MCRSGWRRLVSHTWSMVRLDLTAHQGIDPFGKTFVCRRRCRRVDCTTVDYCSCPILGQKLIMSEPNVREPLPLRAAAVRALFSLRCKDLDIPVRRWEPSRRRKRIRKISIIQNSDKDVEIVAKLCSLLHRRICVINLVIPPIRCIHNFFSLDNIYSS